MMQALDIDPTGGVIYEIALRGTSILPFFVDNANCKEWSSTGLPLNINPTKSNLESLLLPFPTSSCVKQKIPMHPELNNPTTRSH